MPGLEGSTSTRTLLPGGMVSEIVRLDKGSEGREPTEDELDAWVATFPIEAGVAGFGQRSLLTDIGGQRRRQGF